MNSDGFNLSSPVFLHSLNCCSVHLDLILITHALFVFTWYWIYVFEVSLCTFNMSVVGCVHIIHGVARFHGSIKVTWSIYFRIHSLHEEDKTITEAVTTVICACSWNILWLALTPALLWNFWAWFCIKSKLFMRAINPVCAIRS